jgi:hypothetical protein
VFAAALLAVAAVGWSSTVARVRRSDAAELVVVLFLVGSSLVVVPMQALALFGALSHRSIEIVATLLGGGALLAWLVAWRLGSRGPRWPRARATDRVTLALLTAFLALVAYSTVQVYAFPSDAWDGIWYHDTISAWALHAGGAEPMPLPATLVQQTNGFPRNVELASAFVWSLLGRDWVELPNTLAALPMACATFLLARRFGPARASARLALVVALAPGAVLQWRSTYVDVFVAATFLAATHLALDARRPLSAALLASALALGTGAKVTALLFVPGLLVTYACSGAGLRRAVLVAVAPTVALAAWWLPNLAHFGNPVWPLEVRAFGWPGVTTPAEVDVSAGLRGTVEAILLPPPPGRDFADIRKGGWGGALAWIVLPMALAAAVALTRRALTRVGRQRRATQLRLRVAASLLAVIALPVALSPAPWSARYMLVPIAFVGALAAAWGRLLPRARRASSLLEIALVIGALARVGAFEPPLGGASVAQTWRGRARAGRRGAGAPRHRARFVEHGARGRARARARPRTGERRPVRRRGHLPVGALPRTLRQPRRLRPPRRRRRRRRARARADVDRRLRGGAAGSLDHRAPRRVGAPRARLARAPDLGPSPSDGLMPAREMR